MATIYAGPGKLVFGGAVFWPQQENGQLVYRIDQQKQDFANSMFGRVGSTLGGTIGKITVTPFDNWSAIPVLYPQFLGVSSAGAGALQIGTRPHNVNGGADVVGKIWNPSGLLISVNRLAITRHPDMHLGVGKPLFGQVELTALPSIAIGLAVETLNSFHAITENGAADPGITFITADFVREAWTGVWGTAPGFGGDGGAAIQAEDEWTISCSAKYDEMKVQEQTLAMKLSSVEFMAKVRPYGPTWTQINTQVMTGRKLGSRFGNPGTQGAQANLSLTSASSGKIITLENCDVQTEGFEFGGARLTTGEIGFVTQLVPANQLIAPPGQSGVQNLVNISFP